MNFDDFIKIYFLTLTINIGAIHIVFDHHRKSFKNHMIQHAPEIKEVLEQYIND